MVCCSGHAPGIRQGLHNVSWVRNRNKQIETVTKGEAAESLWPRLQHNPLSLKPQTKKQPFKIVSERMKYIYWFPLSGSLTLYWLWDMAGSRYSKNIFRNLSQFISGLCSSQDDQRQLQAQVLPVQQPQEKGHCLPQSSSPSPWSDAQWPASDQVPPRSNFSVQREADWSVPVTYPPGWGHVTVSLWHFPTVFTASA